MRHLRTISVSALVVTFALSAFAQGSGKVAAEALFEEGRKLMAANKPGDACPKFAESNRLDPAAGTLLNLGSCYEAAGKLASAWATYKEAGSLAQSTGRAELVTTAKKRADKVAPKLIRLNVEPSDQPGLVVKRDGATLDRAELGVAIPVDAGEHVVTASAPGKKSFTATIVAKDEGSTLSVKIPALEVDPTAAAAPSAAPPPPPPATASAAPPVAPPPREEADGSSRRTIGYVAGGVGAVGLVAGTFFALSAKSKYSSSKDLCRPDDPNKCSQAGVDARDTARSRGNVATALFAVGVIGVGAGAALVLTAPNPQKTGVRVSPTLSGVVVDGSF